MNGKSYKKMGTLDFRGNPSPSPLVDLIHIFFLNFHN